jgi:hypothetical protein
MDLPATLCGEPVQWTHLCLDSRWAPPHLWLIAKRAGGLNLSATQGLWPATELEAARLLRGHGLLRCESSDMPALTQRMPWLMRRETGDPALSPVAGEADLPPDRAG